METYGIAVFDVCHTLTRTNNTSDFIGFVLKRQRTFRYGLLLLLRILSFLFRLPGLRSLFRRDLWRDCQIALLRGYSPACLREISALYVDHLFAQGLWNGRILDALEQERKQGRTVFLVSAAIDPPIAELAARLGIDNYFASELEVQDGRCTGRLKTDLRGHKESALQRIAETVNWQASSVYSDNAEDMEFMERFGRRHVVLNTCTSHARWKGRREGFQWIVNYEEPTTGQDPDSVTAPTARWIYVPFLYYAVSRLHRRGVHTLLLREVVPVTLTGYLFTDGDAFSFLLLPLSFLMFFSVYEIGGLVNDLCVNREASAQSIRRIAPGVHIHAGLFISVRVAVVGLLSVWLSTRAYPMWFYAGILCFCLAVYLLHTLILSHLRVLTFLVLKICRNTIPLAILASRLPPLTLIGLCAVFFIADAPGKLYVYAHKRRLVQGTIPTWQVRCASAVLLGGLGAILSFVNGSLYLLAFASYHMVLDGLWFLHQRWFPESAGSSGSAHSSLCPPGPTGLCPEDSRPS